MGNVHVVGPNEALVISGGCCGSSSKRFITGGWAWTCCMVSDIQKLTLELFTLTPSCEKIESKQGVPINVTGIAQCKIDKAKVATAAEMFLGKDLDYIKSVVLQTIEGHLRAITGTLSMEEIYLGRDTYAGSVSEMARKDLENFGIALLSFTIKEISDKVEYLTSMGRKDIAKTKHKAAIDVAMVEKDFKIKESDAELAIKETEFNTNREVEEQNKQLQTETAQQDCAVNKKRTEAEMAYGLESAKLRKSIEQQRKNVQLEEANLKLLIVGNQLNQAEVNYDCDIVLEAETEAFRIRKEGEANNYKRREIAKANAYKTKKLADAFAEVVQKHGDAQVEILKNQSAAFSQYKDAAVLQLTLATLPKLTAEIAAPLRNISEIVLVNGPSNQAILSSNFTADAANLASALPPSIKALTGINLTKALDNIINIVPNSQLNVPANAIGHNSNNQNALTSEKNYSTAANKGESVASKNSVNHKSVETMSLMNHPTLVQSSKELNSKSSSRSVSNLSKSPSKKSLLNTKPKSISNLSIHTVK